MTPAKAPPPRARSTNSSSASTAPCSLKSPTSSTMASNASPTTRPWSSTSPPKPTTTKTPTNSASTPTPRTSPTTGTAKTASSSLKILFRISLCPIFFQNHLAVARAERHRSIVLQFTDESLFPHFILPHLPEVSFIGDARLAFRTVVLVNASRIYAQISTVPGVASRAKFKSLSLHHGWRVYSRWCDDVGCDNRRIRKSGIWRNIYRDKFALTLRRSKSSDKYGPFGGERNLFRSTLRRFPFDDLRIPRQSLPARRHATCANRTPALVDPLQLA